MKILVVGSHPQNATGYARVVNKITNYLASSGHDVFIYAIRNYNHVERYVDPSINITIAECATGIKFSYEDINVVLERIKPDCLFIYDEPAIILNFANIIRKDLRPPKLYLYIDLVFPYTKEIFIDEIKKIKPTQIFTFLDCWRDHLINDMGFDKNIVTTLAHGVDGDEFLSCESTIESKRRFGLDADDFLVLNINRNSVRKCIPYTIRSFLCFLVEENLNPKIKLYLHGDPKRESCDLIDLVRVECRRQSIDYRIILNKHIIFSNKTTMMSESDVKYLYNAADVGMNTCCGEGFGLPSIEHSCFNKPQIVTAVPALKETLKDIGYYAEIGHTHMDFSDNSCSGLAMFGKETDFVKHLKYLYRNRDSNIKYRDVILSRYNWGKVLKCLDAFFEETHLKQQIVSNKRSMKIIFVSTDPRMGNGYGRVGNMITNYLANIPGMEVVYYSFQSYEDAFVKDRFVDPRIKIYEGVKLDPKSELGLGYYGLPGVLEIEQPDSIFLYYEPPVIINMMNLIPSHLMPKNKYFYVDLFNKWERIAYFTDMLKHKPTQIFTFLDCWRDHLINDIGFDKKLVTTLPHGIDFSKFELLCPKKSKVALGFNEDDFLIINMNRNSFRKGLDVTIRSFLEFLLITDLNPRIKLYIGSDKNRNGISYDLINLINVECMKRKISPKRILENHIFFSKSPHHSSDETINLVYNAADVGMNTCNGEGFGLTVVEHAYFNKPQIVSSVPAIKETAKEYGFFAQPIMTITGHPTDVSFGDLVYSNEDDHTKNLEYVYNNYTELFLNLNSRNIVSTRYSPENVYKVLDRFFRN